MIIGDGIVLGAGGATASIFVTGLSKTDTVTATKDGKTVIGKWTQKPNPAFLLPSGYTQLEYIESTGTQYINIELPLNSSYIMTKSVTMGLGYIYGVDNYTSGIGNCNMLTEGSYVNVGWGTAWVSHGQVSYDKTGKTNITRISDGSATSFIVNGTSYSAGSSSYLSNPSSFYVFARNNSASGAPSFLASTDLKLYSLSFYTSADTCVRDFIPAKRNSDGAIGMYDLVTNAFFENAGTGAFVAGAEVPQTIGCFLIDKIKSYGTWNVIATDGTNTVTQDVLVDSAIEYDVSISYVDERLQIWLNGSGYTDESLVGNAVTNYGTSLVTSGDFPYYAFDGSNHYIQFPSQTIDPNDFAISLWGYFDGNYSWERFFDFGEGAAKDLWCGHSSTTGNLAFEYQVNSTGYTSNRVSFSSGAWHHIALRGNNGTTTMYVDGASVTSVSNPSVDTLSLANCYLGKSNWNDPYLHGRIADFRLYNTAITEAEIVELYQNGAYVPN